MAGTLILGGCALDDQSMLHALHPDPTIDEQYAQEVATFESELLQFPRVMALRLLEMVNPKAYQCDVMLEACVEAIQRFLWQCHSDVFEKLRDAIAKVRPLVVELQCQMSYVHPASVALITPSAGSSP